jgi:hypothetical protein
MNVQFTLEEERSTVRSNEVSFKVTILNKTEEKIELQSLTPKVPYGVSIEEQEDTFMESSFEKYQDLCYELSELLNNHLKSESDVYVSRLAKVESDLIEKYLRSLADRLKVYYTLMRKSARRQMENQISRSLDTFKYKIKNYADAQWAFEKYLKNSEESLIKGFFEGKLKQLEVLNSSIDSSNSNAIANIEAGSFYSRNYIIKCKRNMVSEKKFTFTIDSQYVGESREKIQRTTASTTIVISPYPFTLSLAAMISSLFGVILKFTLTEMNISSVRHYFSELGTTLITGPGISALIISLLFFNILEFTDIGKRLNIGINWRSAMFIGVIAGLMGERLVESMKVLIGQN